MAIKFPVTTPMFLHLTGQLPADDDLKRCNCKFAGQATHATCGMCKHDLPVFMCQPCILECINLSGRQINAI
jgi:hypothetical protein